MEKLKKCTICKEYKSIKNFYIKNETGKYRSECKLCTLERNKKWASKNKDKIREKRRRHYLKNTNTYKKKRREYYIKNCEKLKAYSREYKRKRGSKPRVVRTEEEKEAARIMTKIKNNIRAKEYYKKNKKRVLSRCKIYREKNKDKYNKYSRKYKKKRLKIDPKYKVKYNFSSLLNSKLRRRLLSKKGSPSFGFLPYTIDDLIDHLESLWEPWMNWDNYGHGHGKWTIDHKIPDCYFNYKSFYDKEFQACWALSNLQPMEFMKNVKKGTNI